MNEKMEVKKRVEWVDFAKGIAILLVILGHTLQGGGGKSGLLRGMIYSFHMPLFFIFSALTFKPSFDRESFISKTKKTGRHLMLPVFLIILIDILGTALLYNHQAIFQIGYWKTYLYRFLFATAPSVNFAGMDIYGLGIPWFFFALFFGRSIFDYCHMAFGEKQLLPVSILLSLLGIVIGRQEYMVFSLDIALAIQFFFYVGYCLKKKDLTSFSGKTLLFWGLSWILLLFVIFPDWNQVTYLELAMRRYPLMPLPYLDAICGTIFLAEIGLLFTEKWKLIAKPFSYIGKNSLYLLCVHAVDGYWSALWKVENSQLTSFIRRICLDLIIFFVVLIFLELKKRGKAKQNVE